ncbi:preprotein translocase subunit YajC [Streptomyces sp. MS2A]|nr:preprotein translocase subunit YajC [Streptomyces sp. MS2A]
MDNAFMTFLSQYGLFFVLALLLVFMIFSTRKRNQKMKAEQEEKQRESVPGARVLLQGGLYGTIVEFDPENLDRPARIEVAPGVVIDVHSQAILRVVTDEPAPQTPVTPLDEREPSGDAPAEPSVETPEETRARLERDSDDDK